MGKPLSKRGEGGGWRILHFDTKSRIYILTQNHVMGRAGTYAAGIILLRGYEDYTSISSTN